MIVQPVETCCLGIDDDFTHSDHDTHSAASMAHTTKMPDLPALGICAEHFKITN
jgi:hypothetical protein